MTRVVYFNEFSGDLTLRCERKPINDIWYSYLNKFRKIIEFLNFL